MPRATQLLQAQHPSQPADAAATLLLLRDQPGGVELLMTRRASTARFGGGLYVFPGGQVDVEDGRAAQQAIARARQGTTQLTEAVAAIRESFEELGILLARDARGTSVAPAVASHLDRRAPLLEQCTASGLRLAAADLYPLARWITGRERPRRFDTAFFVARTPPGQEAVPDQREQFDPVWITPAQALARYGKGDFPLMFPTVRTLERLRNHDTVAAVLAACSNEEPLWTCCSRGGLFNGHERRFMEEEAQYGELALVSPDGHARPRLDWQHEHPVPLLRNVQRLTAANPSFMTGPGTNSYVVGDAGTGHVVIDPGPDDAQHIRRLFDAAGGDIRAIVCTHSHPDHFPGARPLQALCANQPPVLGLPSGPAASAASRFRPDRALADGERLTLTPQHGTAADAHTLRIIHTPGHASNHLCLLLEEDALLFSGDHILNGSTTVIDAPDGNMTDYLDSLDRLDAVCAATGTDFILPAHGHVLHGARQVIAHLKQHRLAREARVLAAMRAIPHGDLDDWVKIVYDDVPRRIWPVAKRSLLAHVQRIRTLQMA